MILGDIIEKAMSKISIKNLSNIELILDISNSLQEEVAVESVSIGEVIYVEGVRFVNYRESAIIAKYESYLKSEDYGKEKEPDFERWYEENVKDCLIIKGAEK